MTLVDLVCIGLAICAGLVAWLWSAYKAVCDELKHYRRAYAELIQDVCYWTDQEANKDEPTL